MYIDRENGLISALYQREQYPGQEFIANDDQEIIDLEMSQAKKDKYVEIYTHADSLIAEQEATFFNKGVSANRNKDRLSKQQNKRNNKKIKSIPLSPQEELEDDRYDSFLDWSDSVYDEADLANDVVELLTNINDVKSYDMVDDPNWPIWT